METEEGDHYAMETRSEVTQQYPGGDKALLKVEKKRVDADLLKLKNRVKML